MKLTLHHINVTSHDVPGLDAFYADVLGLGDVPEMRALPTIDEAGYAGALAFRASEGIQFHLAEKDMTLAVRLKQGINPLMNGHIAFRTDDIRAFIAHLDAHGIPYVDYGTTFTEHWHQIFFHDPAGTVIEVHQVLGQSGDPGKD